MSRLGRTWLLLGRLGAALAGLLLVRLVLLLFAARPDSLVVALVLALTGPLVWPFQTFDLWLGQPRFGARLEVATLVALALLTLLVVSGYSIAWRKHYGRLSG